MNVTIVGTGYVGPVVGVFLSNKGHLVACIDKNTKVIAKLSNSIPTIDEVV